MKAQQQYAPAPVRTGRFGDARTAKLDAARARVIVAGGPSLSQLSQAFRDSGASEVSGKVKPTR